MLSARPTPLSPTDPHHQPLTTPPFPITASRRNRTQPRNHPALPLTRRIRPSPQPRRPHATLPRRKRRQERKRGPAPSLRRTSPPAGNQPSLVEERPKRRRLERSRPDHSRRETRPRRQTARTKWSNHRSDRRPQPAAEMTAGCHAQVESPGIDGVCLVGIYVHRDPITVQRELHEKYSITPVCNPTHTTQSPWSSHPTRVPSVRKSLTFETDDVADLSSTRLYVVYVSSYFTSHRGRDPSHQRI